MAAVTREAEDLADALAGNVRISIAAGLYSTRHAYDELVKHGVPMMEFDKSGALRAQYGAIKVTPDVEDDAWTVRWMPDARPPDKSEQVEQWFNGLRGI